MKYPAGHPVQPARARAICHRDRHTVAEWLTAPATGTAALCATRVAAITATRSRQ